MTESVSVLRWLSVVRNRGIRNMVFFQYFRLTVHMFFDLDFFISLMCVWLKKTTVLVICIHKRVKSIVFAVSINFCYKSGQAILKRYTYYGSLETVAEKICIINLQNHHCCILKPICTCKYDNDISSIPHDLYDWFLLTALKLFYLVKVTDNRWSGKKPLYWLG